ncbi:MAG: L,D-transpeptidase, partial [Solirubrobacteraceae bacterium]
LLTAGAFPQASHGSQIAHPASGSQIAPQQELVTLLTAHGAHDRPSAKAGVSAVIDATRPITGEPTVLPVLAQAIDRRGRFWLRVRLPGRTLGGRLPPPTGWIIALHTRLSTTPWHLVVDLRARQLTVYYAGRLLDSYPAIVGKPSTPTPKGQYFVEENVRMSTGQPGGPFALATSDRSHVLRAFDGGPGQIAVHGLENLGGKLGTAESHGCIRIANGAITWLAARIQPGVPLTIR